ncbi:MAG: hypothetical protein QW416_06780 [Candidatus Nitrosocaldaceae archaeon]
MSIGYSDERLIISRDALNRFEFKLKLLEIDETVRPPNPHKFGHRVLVKKILTLIKDLATNNVQEIELDLDALEKRIIKERSFTSANRWVSHSDIKNGYIVGWKHAELLANAIALDVIKI